MRMFVMATGWGLTLTAAVMLIAGLMAAAPSMAGSHMSAAGQIATQNWELARGFQHMLLAGIAQIAGLAALILERLLPQP